MDTAMVFWSLLGLSLCLTVLAPWRRSWWLMAIAAVLSLPFALVAFAPFYVTWLLPSFQLAAAIALRWRGGVADWAILLLLAVLMWLVSGAGTVLIDGRLVWVQLAGLFIGIAALLVGPTLWMKAMHLVAVPHRG